MNYYLFLFAVIIFNTGCKSESYKPVRFSELKEYSLNQGQTDITLLRSFINNGKCDSIKNVFYANAFLCEVNKTKDTILVYSICRKPFEFLKDNFTGPMALAIDSAKVVKYHPDQVLTAIDDLLFAKRYKYVVADIGNYLEN
jgi:hypothetical protein